MRKVLLGAATALAITAPGLANADTTGHVGVTYGNTEPETGDDISSYGIDGAVATDLDGGLMLQFDATSVSADSGGDAGLGAATVHIAKRGSGHALGAFFGLTDFAGSSIKNVGAEGQLYLSQVTFNASAAYGFADGGGSDLDLWTGHADGTFFFTDNLGLTGGVTYSDIEEGGFDDERTTWSADAAYRFTGSGFSVFGGYANTEFDGGDSSDLFHIGLRYDFGTPSLKARSQTGASLTGGRSLLRQIIPH